MAAPSVRILFKDKVLSTTVYPMFMLQLAPLA